MSLIDNYTEPFDLVAPDGRKYGSIKLIIFDDMSIRSKVYKEECKIKKVSCLFYAPLNDYDVIRRCSDGSAYRIFNVRHTEHPEATFAGAVPYELWKSEYDSPP